MKLEPVYLLAPRPRPTMPSRRAFLWMGLAFAGGSVLGTACGYSMRSAVAAERPVSATAGAEPEVTGDSTLDELHRLAVAAPIEELMDRAVGFVGNATQDYPGDPVLWRGMGRIAEQLVRDPKAPSRRALGRVVAQAIESARAGEGAGYVDWVPSLRALK